ncbi:MAG: hypothetical protein J5962_01085, partial [Lachnospiraceae bacterium]|nr:hypothetical protein [Lachnospiraceae bacterium]
MRVHELAKEISGEIGRQLSSTELLTILNKKKEGLKPQSSVTDELIAYAKNIYKATSSPEQSQAKSAEKKSDVNSVRKQSEEKSVHNQSESKPVQKQSEAKPEQKKDNKKAESKPVEKKP